MDRIITYNLGEDFINNIADYIYKNIIGKGYSLSKTAIIFGGKRPELFLKKELSKRIKGAYLPPCFFSIDEFTRYIVSKKETFRRIEDINACYIIYKIVAAKTPDVLRNNTSFSQFLPWARELISFIDELDLEDIENKSLNLIQKSAEIGYDLPPSINTLLKSITTIRQEYHAELSKRKRLSRGLLYNMASQYVKEKNLNEFENILFCNFFYLHKTEVEIIKDLYKKDKAILFFQKDSKNWKCFESLEKILDCKIEPPLAETKQYNIGIYSGFGTHSQTGIIRSQILNKITDYEKTVIVLPDTETLIPLLSELPPEINKFNISMGYPLKRSAVFALLKSIIEAQISKKNNSYYTKDYLKVLLNPLIKNLNLCGDPALTRTLTHKTEEILLGIEETELSKNLFIELESIQNLDKVYTITEDILTGQLTRPALSEERTVNRNTTKEDLKKILLELHNISFKQWEDIRNFSDLRNSVLKLLNLLIFKSFAENYPLNLKVIDNIISLTNTFKHAEFKDEPFPKEEIFKIFMSMLERELIAFKGSPLCGLQILGLLETRTLSFENVIVMDANESILPKLKLHEPLIPKQIMAELDLNRLEAEEEIQRYHFMRLITSAKNVYITYDSSPEKERSRFIEELIWEKQKEENKLFVLPENKAGFNIKVIPDLPVVQKNAEILNILDNISFSPSSIDTYLTCPMQFYSKHILGLKEKEELADEPQSNEIGNFLHELLEDTFKDFLNKELIINNKFKNIFFKYFDSKFEKELKNRIGSDAFMVKKIMEYKLDSFLANEQTRSNEIKQIIGLEDPSFGRDIKINNKTIRFKCRIDRIDKLQDESILIIDYKSGSSAKTPQGAKKLMEFQNDRQCISDKIHSFQLPLYCYFAKQKYKDIYINACLYNLKNTELTYFINPKEEDSAGLKLEKCMEALFFIVEEIFNPDKPFQADDKNKRICNHCPFIYMCR